MIDDWRLAIGDYNKQNPRLTRGFFDLILKVIIFIF